MAFIKNNSAMNLKSNPLNTFQTAAERKEKLIQQLYKMVNGEINYIHAKTEDITQLIKDAGEGDKELAELFKKLNERTNINNSYFTTI